MIADEILKSIKIFVDEATKNIKSDIVAPIVSVQGNLCTVMINNIEYNVKNGINYNFKVGDICLVHCINGNFQDKIIIAKL